MQRTLGDAVVSFNYVTATPFSYFKQPSWQHFFRLLRSL